MEKTFRTGGMVEHPSWSRIVFLVIAYIVLIGLALLCVLPLWHVIMASISDGYSLFLSDGLLLLPAGGIDFGGYGLVFAMSEVWLGYLWTIIYVVATMVLGVFLTMCGGYYLAKKTLWTKPISIIILLTMMFNGGLIPTYMVIRTLGMVNTPLALIVPGCTNAIYVMMAMTTFRGIPASVEEAAELDGAGHWRTMFQISFPMAKGMMMVIAMNIVVYSWNAWFPASIYLPNARDFWPLQLVMRDLIDRYSEANIMQDVFRNNSEFTIQYVLSVISTLPILVACPFFQRYFGNMALGAVKE